MLKDNVQVRWAKADGSSQDESEEDVSAGDLDAQGARGLFEWVCEVGPGKSVDVTLAWEVVAPIGTEWTTDSLW